MILKILALTIVAFLVWLAYNSMPRAPARISQPVRAYDSQYDVFRDMEPNTQTRENPWVGFIQEDVYQNRTGPIGNFIGNDAKSGSAVAYMVTA
jgi:hypothetical protein